MGTGSSRMCASLLAPQPKVEQQIPGWTPDGWRQPHRYLVKEGDTIQSVAAAFLREVNDILQSNPVIRYQKDKKGVILPLLEYNPPQTLIIVKNERDKYMWYARGALNGHPMAQYCLSLMYAGEDGQVTLEWEDQLAEEIEQERQKEIQRRRLLGQKEDEINWFSSKELKDVGMIKGKGMRHHVLDPITMQQILTLPRRPTDGPASAVGRSGSLASVDISNKTMKVDDAVLDNPETTALTPEEEKVVTSFFWLRLSALQGLALALYRLGNIFYFNNDMVRLCLRDERRAEYLLLASKTLTQLREEKKKRDGGEEPDPAEDGPAETEDAARDRLAAEEEDHINKLEAAMWYERAGQQHHKESAAQLAKMYTDGVGVARNYINAIEWHKIAGKPAHEAEVEVANHMQAAAAKGNVKAMLQFARMYVEGIGVKMDWDKAMFWFKRGGKSEKYAQQQIENKKDSLRLQYQQLFSAHDLDRDGNLDKDQFRGFFICALMASRNMKLEAAHLEAIQTYQGKQRSDFLFGHYDVNKDYSVSFDEIWKNRQRDALFPKNEKEFGNASDFFRRWIASGCHPVLPERQSSTLIEKMTHKTLPAAKPIHTHSDRPKSKAVLSHY